jgi:hypothetical protein
MSSQPQPGGFHRYEEPTSERELMKVEQARQMAKEKIKQLAQELERGQSETLKAYLAAMAKFPRYSPSNVWLILTQRPDARHVAGLTTWNRLGRYVRKGEHGIAILAPCVRRPKSNASETTPTHERPEDDRKSKTDEIVVSFRGAHVFDVSQTDGAPLPEPACVHGDPGVFLDRLKQVVADNGIMLSYSDAIAPARGAALRDRILLLPNLTPAEEFSTLAHELGHCRLHRTADDLATSKTVRETEAEAVAFIICQAIRLDTSTASSDYVALYLGDTKTLAASLERIQRVATEIIAGIGPDI